MLQKFSWCIIQVILSKLALFVDQIVTVFHASFCDQTLCGFEITDTCKCGKELLHSYSFMSLLFYSCVQFLILFHVILSF
jgi:hypothetical protein